MSIFKGPIFELMQFRDMLGTSYVEDLMTKKNSARSKANELQKLGNLVAD